MTLRSWYPIAFAIVISVVIRSVTKDVSLVCQFGDATAGMTRKMSSNLTQRLQLLPGELPGYTGWARPQSTLADSFVVTLPNYSLSTGNKFTFDIQCTNPYGAEGRAVFFVRAYGPSIITGHVMDRKNGTYQVSMTAFDEGTYQLEVVLSYSKREEWTSYPTKQQAGYEGYLLPGFPTTIDVTRAGASLFANEKRQTAELPFCSSSDILQTNPVSALEQGRWKVESKVRASTYNPKSSFDLVVTKDYATGVSGIGYRMKFEPAQCRLLSPSNLRDRESIERIKKNSTFAVKPLHIVFIGDSNMFRSMYSFEKYFEQESPWHITKIPTHGGLHRRLGEIRTTLDELAKLDRQFFIIFNAGLHDIEQLCYKARQKNRAEILNTTDDNFSCTAGYEEVVEQFVDLVDDFPALLKVWQTTTAGWPKYGNFGNAWPTWEMQRLPLDPSAVEHFNGIAWSILMRKKINVMDGFWLTLARPDHREAITESQQNVGKRLAHAGPEVYATLSNQWLLLILEKLDSKFGQYFL